MHHERLSQKTFENNMKALNIAKPVKLEASIINNLGNDYQQLSNFDKTLEFHTMALDLAHEIVYRILESSCILILNIDDVFYITLSRQ